jgi:hypothetical protein
LDGIVGSFIEASLIQILRMAGLAVSVCVDASNAVEGEWDVYAIDVPEEQRIELLESPRQSRNDIMLIFVQSGTWAWA